jgi:hypothetical protein
VNVRAERARDGNGRVYRITFNDGIRDYTFKVGVPLDMDTLLVDDGDATSYDSAESKYLILS